MADTASTTTTATKDKEDREGGFYCDICDCIVKDSLTYLDHINGRKHNKKLGTKFKDFKDSTLDEVKEMLEFKRREREQKTSDFILDDGDFEEKRKKMAKEKRKRQKARRAGLSLTGANHDTANYDKEGEDDDDAGYEDPTGKGNDNCDTKREEADDETVGELDMMQQLMGFSSFSSKR